MASLLSVREKITRLARERVLILDGAMGALIQAHRTSSGAPLSEDDFRGLPESGGGRFKAHPLPLKGCNDLLCLTMPDLISGIHEAYLKAGADIIETCSFNANAVSLAEYGLEKEACEISAAAARLARKAADRFSTEEKPRFVAGSMGPTSKSAGISQDISDPGKRAITWDELEAAYYDNARGLLDGGADLIIIETIFDTLNAKAAIFAVLRLAEERGIDVPLIISATVSAGGRLLSGQTVEAFCVSVSHANPLALGLNCSFGPEKLKAPVAAVSAAVPCLVSAYPNAGLPNSAGAYDESPESMADHIEEYLREGLVNITGGCCGSTPAHIAAIAGKAKNYAPRPLPPPAGKTRLAGLEVLEVSQELAKAGPRARLAENSEFLRFIMDGNYDEAVDIAREMIEDGAAFVELCVDALSSGSADAKAVITNFLNTALVFPDIARLPFVIAGSRWDLVEAALKCLSGKGIAYFYNPADGEAEFLRRARLARAFGAAVALTFPEGGEAAPYRSLLEKAGFTPQDIVFSDNY